MARRPKPRELHYTSESGISGYRAGDVLVNDDTGERSIVVRDGRGLVLEPEKRSPGRPQLGKGETVGMLIKVPTETRGRWRAFAAKQGIKVAELVREAVETAIARGSSR